MGANPTLIPPSSLFWLLRHMRSLCAQGPCTEAISTFEKIPLGCYLPLQTSAWLSTQSNFLSSPEFSWVMASCSPSLLPASGVTQLPSFSGTVPGGDHCPSRYMSLALCHLLSFYPPSDFRHPGLSWCESETSPLWEGREPLSCYY